MKVLRVIILGFLLGLIQMPPACAQEFKKWEAQIAEYKKWLDSLGPNGARYWVRLDEKRRPHGLYVGEGFFRADYHGKKQFVEIYSSYLAGHPDKSMLIDIFDSTTHRPVGEYGWGGFKLHDQRN